MTPHELLFILLPLVLLLVSVMVHEYRTKLILDKVVFPSALFFLTVACLFGSMPWWNYVAGLVSVLAFFLFCAWFYENMVGRDFIGGGTIKLLAVVGAAMGWRMGLEISVVCLVLICACVPISMKRSGVQSLPSSPIILLSVLCVLAWHHRDDLLAMGGGWVSKCRLFLFL